MTKKSLMIATALSTTLLVSAPGVAFAQTATPTTRMELRKDIREERQDARQEIRTDRIKIIADRVESRFNRHTQRLQNLINRSKTRADKLKAEGKDVTAATTAITTAQSDLDKATQLGKDAVAKLRAITPANWDAQKPEVAAAKEAVRTAQQAYVQVLKDLRGVVGALASAHK
jgi:tRNA U34 5-carboxymethylaminomethyl modifying enzyme MnmG/GidA